MSAAALLAACAGGTPAPQTPAAPGAPAPAPAAPAAQPAAPVAAVPGQPTPGVAARDRFQLAVNMLQDGNPNQANVELKAYLAEVPNSPQARLLVSQIETPIAMLYPVDNFTVQLAPGETLGSLATTYLGDVLNFYGLARYNDISVPARVREGQTIKIPRTPAAVAALAARGTTPLGAQPPGQAAGQPAAPPPTQAVVTPARPAAPRDPWAIIRTEVAAGRFDAAVREAEASRVMPDRMQAVVLASAYAGSARTVRATDAMLAGTLATRAGELYLETADRPEDAIVPLQMALEINPMNMRAQTMLASAKTQAADIHYRAGLTAFQRQDLDGAIAAWDRVLAIDPEHRNAQLQKAQALELKANLQRLRP